MEISSSNSQMNSDQDIEELLNYRFKERLEVSQELHNRIVASSVTNKSMNPNFYWFAAAGLAILICLNLFSILDYTKQVKHQQLKELYANDLNNPTVF
jgi:hypothetical protein